VPRFLGMISFSLYLWHIPMLQMAPWITTMMERSGMWQPWLLGRIVLMALVIAVSTASFSAVEKPAQRWLQRVFATWVARPAPVQAAEVA